jgi:hypothetical protein
MGTRIKPTAWRAAESLALPATPALGISRGLAAFTRLWLAGHLGFLLTPRPYHIKSECQNLSNKVARVQWIEEQFQTMERDHAREEGRGENRPIFSYIKEYALIKMMRAAYAVLEELSELIPA